MRREVIRIEGYGPTLVGELRTPSTPAPFPAVVHGPGWLGLATTASYEPYHRALAGAGFAVVVFDYRGFGGSDGDATTLDPAHQIDDWTRAVQWARQHPSLLVNSLGVFGTGATGGGNAIIVAEREPDIQALVAQVPIADGADWLRRMRDRPAWEAFEARIAADRERRARGEPSELVLTRGELTVSRESREGWKADVGGRVPERVTIASAEAIMRYRPIDARPTVPTMIVAVEGDTVTPMDHAQDLYEVAASPKRFVLQRGTTHYRAYNDYRSIVIPMIVEWFERHLGSEDRAASGADEMVTVP